MSSSNLCQVASALSTIEQPSVVEVATKAQVVGKLEAVTKPLRKSIVKHGLSNHTDNDDICKLILSMFMEFADTISTFFSRRVKVLETVSRCKCCLMMLDIGCNDLSVEMFNIFFSVVRSGSFLSLFPL
ncbi:hypothetical protein CRYUN_Cryun28dG0042400 [Craigia yunnanensis]